MPKNFWNRCIKKFFRITIPTLIAFLTIFTFFSEKFENTIKTFGIFGAIIVILLCFSLTLLYESNEMVQFVDIIDNEFFKDEKSNERIIYNYYNTYKIERKNYKKNNSKIIKDCVLYKCKKKDIFTNKYLKIEDVHNDAFQEICFELLSSGIVNLINIINFPTMYQLICDIPKSMNDINVISFIENIEHDYKYNVLVNFSGKINGSVLLCFSEEIKNVINFMFRKYYLRYLTDNNYDYYFNSYIYELGSIFTGGCLTSLSYFSNLANNKFWIRKINVNVNTNYLKIKSSTENISVTSIRACNYKGDYFFTSYIMFDESNVNDLLNNIYY